VKPAELQRELQKRGLAVLGVVQSRQDPGVLVVYLHGEAGQWASGRARRKILKVPGVLEAADSAPTPTVILVRVKISRHDAGGGEDSSYSSLRGSEGR
jgi:hypothetical protein